MRNALKYLGRRPLKLVRHVHGTMFYYKGPLRRFGKLGDSWRTGYAKGLAFAGDPAIVGLSLPRENRPFQGLPLDDALAKNGSEPRCDLIIVDLNSGDTIAW